MTPTYPDFEVTLIHTSNGLEFIRATIEGRLCNVHCAAAAYMAGERKPHYPVPACRGIPMFTDYVDIGFWDAAIDNVDYAKAAPNFDYWK